MTAETRVTGPVRTLQRRVEGWYVPGQWGVVHLRVCHHRHHHHRPLAKVLVFDRNIDKFHEFPCFYRFSVFSVITRPWALHGEGTRVMGHTRIYTKTVSKPVSKTRSNHAFFEKTVNFMKNSEFHEKVHFLVIERTRTVHVVISDLIVTRFGND